MANKIERFDFNVLVKEIKETHENLAAQAGRAINISLTLRNWLIGAYIAEYELRGADRASYGEKLLYELAKRLTILKVSNCSRRQAIPLPPLLSGDCGDTVPTIEDSTG